MSVVEQVEEIGGMVGVLAEKYGWTASVTAEVHRIFCEQARNWESKVKLCEDRIINQRQEINRLLGLK